MGCDLICAIILNTGALTLDISVGSTLGVSLAIFAYCTGWRCFYKCGEMCNIALFILSRKEKNIAYCTFNAFGLKERKHYR